MVRIANDMPIFADRIGRLSAELVQSRSDPSGRIILVEEAARVRR